MNTTRRDAFKMLLAGAVTAPFARGAERAVAHPRLRPGEVRYAGDGGGPAVGPTQYGNLIGAGFYPDPSSIRVGDDVYLLTSTCYLPGLRAAWGHDV